MEDEEEDALAHANALRVERCSSLSVLSGLLGLAHVLGYLQVGEDWMEEGDEDAPACANALKVKQHGGLSASSGLLGLACILDFLWVGED